MHGPEFSLSGRARAFSDFQDRKDPFQLNLDTYKVIEGAPEFMGTLSCQYQGKQAR